MEQKIARLTLLIDPNKKEAFERLCALQDRTASQVVRQLTRNYLAQHGVHAIACEASASECMTPSDMPALRTKSSLPGVAPLDVRRARLTPRPES